MRIMRHVLVLLFGFIGISSVASWTVSARPANNLAFLGGAGGATNPIAIAGQYAYIGEGLGLTVLDISDPNQPIVVGRTPAFAVIDVIVVSGDYVYATVQPFGDLWVIDVRDPTKPLQVSYDDNYWVKALSIDSSYLYAADFGGGLHIYDVSNPTVLQEVGYLQTTGFPSGVDAAGGLAFVADSSGGLWIVDVSDPTTPLELARIEVSPGQHVLDVSVVGDLLYTEYDGVFRVINISDPTNPTAVGTVNVFSGADVIEIAGDYAFVINGFGDVVSINISDPENPQSIAVYEAEDKAQDLATVGHYLYFTDQGLWGLDMTSPANPVEIGRYKTTDWMEAVVVAGNYAYVADQEKGLMVVDVSVPTLPQPIGFYNGPRGHGARDIALNNNYIYLAASFDGLRVIDVSNPAMPNEVGSFDGSTTAARITVHGNYAYLIDSSGDFYVIDVSDPVNPTEVATYDLGRIGTIQVAGDYAHIAAGDFYILDISNPVAITEVGVFDPGNGAAVDVDLVDDYAFVAVSNHHVLALDINDPTQIEEVGSFSTDPNAVAVAGGLAYVVRDFGVLEMFDVSNPAHPLLLDSVEFPGLGTFTDVYAVDDQIFVAGINNGLLLYEVAPVLPHDKIVYLPIVLR